MTCLQKDVLLIGDTFVANLLAKKNQDNGIEHMDNTTKQFLPSAAFEDSFFNALREDFQQITLSDTIEDLLNNSINPAGLHLSSILEKEGFSYDVINCSLKHHEKLVSFLKSTKYRVIGISTTFTLDRAYILNLIDLIKRNAPTSKIIVGGIFIVKLFKLQKKEILQKELSLLNADYFVFNEIGEQSLIDILNYEQYSKPDIQKVLNIAYKTESGFIINSYKTNDIDTSISNWILSNNTNYAFLRTSISCLFKCKFCDFPLIADKYKSKSIEVIQQEFKNIEKAGIKYIHFLDDTFNIPKQHFYTILNELAIKGYNFEWVAYIRCQHLDNETVSLMKETGCIGVFLGLESGNNDVLKNMNKGATVEKYLDGISFLHKYEIPTYGAFIIGFPGETNKSIEDTIRFIKQARLQYYRLFLWFYDLRCPIAHEAVKYSLEGSGYKWKHSTMTSDEAVEKCKFIWKEVNNSIHCTIPFDYTFYLNRNVNTKDIFNECLRRFNERNASQF
ncbi:MAG: radical SAM protein [bacterium]